MEILCVCPANCVTGGPECIHEFVSELNKQVGVHARIWYWDISSYPPQPEEYRHYGCDYVTDLPEGYDDVLIVPEIWANRIMDYPQCKRAVYWLGLDAYAGWTPAPERGKILEDEDVVHITQSAYAYSFLKLMGVKHLVMCTDFVNPAFYEEYEEEERNNVVLYNPAKATPFMHEIIAACPGIEWKPIQGMRRAEVINTMRHSKLYVDFGEFPGRERMPREAVLCGCCIITSKIGSAYYYKDFFHDYKFDSKPGHMWAIIRKIQYVLDHYEECRKDFDLFRIMLRDDKEKVGAQCADVIMALEEIQHEVQYNHTGA